MTSITTRLDRLRFESNTKPQRMRKGLSPERLRPVYVDNAGRYDRLHGVLTAWSDQR